MRGPATQFRLKLPYSRLGGLSGSLLREPGGSFRQPSGQLDGGTGLGSIPLGFGSSPGGYHFTPVLQVSVSVAGSYSRGRPPAQHRLNLSMVLYPLRTPSGSLVNAIG